MSRRREAVRKALEWIESNQAVEHYEPLPGDPELPAGRPWVDDWQTAWAETTLDVVKRAWHDCGARMYRSQGELYDDLRGYLTIKAQEFANAYQPKWTWNDPERAWGAYLWHALHSCARWHFATTIGKRNDENKTAHSEMHSRDARIEAMLFRASPAGQMRVANSISPLAAWRPISPDGYVTLVETLEAEIHHAAEGTLPALTGCPEPGCDRPITTTRPHGQCEHHYRKNLMLWGQGPRCAMTGCPDAATARGYCRTHYATERNRRERAGTPWVKAEYPDTCTVDQCNAPHLAQGRCDSHYAKWRRTQMPPCTEPGCESAQDSLGLCSYHRLKLKEATAPPCSVDDCTTGAVLKGMCRKHYRAQARAQGRNA